MILKFNFIHSISLKRMNTKLVKEFKKIKESA